MTPQTKSRLVHAALALLLVWPAVHLGLVARYDLSPWKLAGWGMYSAPRFGLIGMEVYGRPAAGGEWQQLTTPSPAVAALATSFLERHRWLRRLASHREMVEQIRAEHPQWSDIRVVVSYPALAEDTGKVVLDRDERLDRSSVAQSP